MKPINGKWLHILTNQLSIYRAIFAKLLNENLL